jgi:5-methyltetrahydrofolate--homocysteine methyltransferase
MNEESMLETLSNHIIDGNYKAKVQEQGVEASSQPGVSEQIRALVKKNVKARQISEAVLDRSMKTSIQKYFNNEFLVPDLVDRAKSIGTARDVLAESTGEVSPFTTSKAVLATIHSAGPTYWRDTVRVLLEGFGFNAIDLGNNISVNQLVQSVEKEEPDLLGIALPTAAILPDANTVNPTAVKSAVNKTLSKLSEKGYRKDVTVMVGGQMPGVDSAKAIGADYYCTNFNQTVAALDLCITLQTLRDKCGISFEDTIAEYNRLDKHVANL